MTDTSIGKTVELPQVEVMNAEAISDCLENGQVALIHRRAIMQEPYALEVVAERTVFNDIGRISLFGTYSFSEGADPSALYVLRDRFFGKIRALDLGSHGIVPTFVSNDRKNLRLFMDDGRVSVTTWFSQTGKPPMSLHISNNRRDGQHNRIASSPPRYDKGTLAKQLATYMRLLSVVDGTLGHSAPTYAVDFIESRNPRRQDASRSSKKQRQPRQNTESKAPQTNTKLEETARVFDAKYKPRLTTPNARLSDVRGMDFDDREDLNERILSFLNPELATEYGVHCSGGILLYGPPGTGKTMTAGAIMNELKARMWQIDGPDLIDKWVGDSAKNVRNVFSGAIEVAKLGPLVLLFDEIDSIISTKGDSTAERTAAQGEFKRQLGHIAAQIPNILVVATTNHMNDIDESLMRDGRFDKKIYMKLPDDETRLQILINLINFDEVQQERLFDDSDNIDFQRLVSASHGMSGATIENVIKACRRQKFRQHVEGSLFPGPITSGELLSQFQNHKEQSQAF